MHDEYLQHRGPSTLWVMTAASAAAGQTAHHVATPLPVVVTAAGLVSAIRFGDDAMRRRDPQVAQWDAIRHHYQDVAEWIDLDADCNDTAPSVSENGGIGRGGRADMVDYLGLLDCGCDDGVRRDDLTWWLSGHPDYWVTACESVEAEAFALPEFRDAYEYAATIGPLTIYRRRADAS